MAGMSYDSEDYLTSSSDVESFSQSSMSSSSMSFHEMFSSHEPDDLESNPELTSVERKHLLEETYQTLVKDYVSPAEARRLIRGQEKSSLRPIPAIKKYQWPVHIRNLRRTIFPLMEPLEEFFREVKPDLAPGHAATHSNETRKRSWNMSKLPFPLADHVNLVYQESTGPNVSAMKLVQCVQEGERFVDQALEIVLKDIARALQGKNSHVNPHAFETFGQDHRPCGNWKFIRDQLLNPTTMNHVRQQKPMLPLQPRTIARIHARIAQVFPRAGPVLSRSTESTIESSSSSTRTSPSAPGRRRSKKKRKYSAGIISIMSV